MKCRSLAAPIAALLCMAQPVTTRPKLLTRTDPEYSQEARRAQVSARVLLNVTVGADGTARNITVSQFAGFGLDEAAVQAVSQWRFEPGTVEFPDQKIEVSFSVLRPSHEGQLARLRFPTDPAARPELLSGVMPVNPPSAPGAYRFRANFVVATDGSVRDVSIAESPDPVWSDGTVDEIRKWKFTPPTTEVQGTFELFREQRGVGTAAPAAVSAQLAAPRLLSPPEGEVFNTYPRTTVCKWEAVPGAKSYLFEWDYSSRGVWHADEAKMVGAGFPVEDTEYSFDFVGAQPGRWRVWPVGAHGERGNPSEWRTFRYTR